MLTDTKIRSLKATGKLYKITDRDGLYVAVTPSGTISFRYNYKINNRQETLTIGAYGIGGITLAEARAKQLLAKKLVQEGVSPAREKIRTRAREVSAGTFSEWAVKWLKGHKMADSTRDMRRSVYERDLKTRFGKLQLREISSEDVRSMANAIVARGAPATAIHAREIVLLVFRYAIERGQKVGNPAEEVAPSTIATFEPKDRALTKEEIRIFYQNLEKVGTTPSIRAACKLLLLTLLRKGELTNAKWADVNFTEGTLTIPAARMKARRPHIVFLAQQAMDLLAALKMFAGSSDYVFPSRYEIHKPMSAATLNRVMTLSWEYAQKDGHTLAKFGPHDMRRTGSTILHEAGYNSDWIEKTLAHEQKGVRAVYNKAEYREQRKAMLQDWADMIDSWTAPQ
ncbi:tyrosine-type recombinase/integrase [Comamonas sp.]|uniref:tyrosine-type recombinase/integrase n=1 Tax=Comamonas sp. TaxID=34028 RepID=UPI003A8E6EF5